MSKYIEIVDYTDLCSMAFIKSLDSMYDVVCDESTDKMVFNIANKKVRELFEYHMDMEIQHISSFFGKKVIIIDTCTLKKNWKRYSISVDDRVINDKYCVIDDSLLIDLKALTKILERKWKDLCKRKNVITLSFEQFDIHDIRKTIISLIGKDHIKRYESDFKIIDDLNMNYFGILEGDSLDDLKDKVTGILINNNLLI